MINFETSETWEKFKDAYLLDQSCTIIDLRFCHIKEDYVMKLENTMHDIDSCRLQTGRSLDALNDVMKDYFYDQWLKAPTIYILGWKKLMEELPMLSQHLLSIFYSAHRDVVWGNVRAAFEGEERLEDLRIHDEIQNGVKINLVLN